MDKFIGKRLDGRYEFKELIGIGGMANVYRAYDIVEQKDVAIKVLKEEFLGNEEFVKRFRNESKAVASLSHPNIVRIFDVNFGDRIQYIVMELIDGITLKEFIEKSHALDWKDTVHFTIQILRALQHAHDKGIVHRDIKPQNIMLLQDGTIKVMDFGIARFARDEKRSQDKAIGSVHYISPEQASGGITDAKSDLYSVGVMMYEMLTGKLPFDGDTPEKVAVKQMQSVAVLPRKINENIPEGLEEIIVRAMQKAPSKRYQSAAEMLRDIDEFKKNPDIVFEYKYFSDDDGTTKYFDMPLAEESKKKALDENSPEDDKKKSKLIPILLGVSAAVVLVTILLVTLLLNMQAPAPTDVMLKDFKGMQLTDVQAIEDYKNIKWDVEEEYNNDYDSGVVYKQDPEGGILVKSNSKVKLFVSKGAQKINLPDVTNMPLQDAVSKLKNLGFSKINQVEEDNKDITANYVIRTDPQGGEQVATNTEITIYYSNGKGAKVDVPNVVGKMKDDGKSLLEALGLTVNIATQASSQPEGTIIAQSATGQVEAKSTITLTVSSGGGEQSVTVNITLPTGSGTYKLSVFANGTQIASNNITLTSKTGKYSFKDTGSNEEKHYVIMAYDANGRNGMQFVTLTINYKSNPPSESGKSQDNSVFDKISHLTVTKNDFRS